MILAVAWAKQQKLIDQEATWYQQKWDRGMVLENNKTKLVLDVEFPYSQRFILIVNG